MIGLLNRANLRRELSEDNGTSFYNKSDREKWVFITCLVKSGKILKEKKIPLSLIYNERPWGCGELCQESTPGNEANDILDRCRWRWDDS